MKQLILIFLGIFALGYLSSCDNDDDVIIGLTDKQEDFPLFQVDNSGIQGTAFFKEREDGTTVVRLLLQDTNSGDSHPAHIHFNSAAEGGDIAISLTPVSGNDGISETIITQTDAGNNISYQELIAFDGYINVHQSADNTSTLLAQGDIGPNEFIGAEAAEFYELRHPDPEIGGNIAKVSFKERVSGETLVEIIYTGTTDVPHPAHIHTGTAAMGGPIAISLEDVDLSGRSATNISEDDAGNPLTYEDLINYNGYINIHQSADNMSTIISQGDIGRNEFTGRFTEPSYDLNQVNASGIAGVATFYERNDGTFLAAVELGGTMESSVHPVHIHNNSVADGGGIAISLNNAVNGLSLTEVDAFDDSTPVTYEGILGFNGHINVHQSPELMAVYVARGDIGSNRP